jgi:hypothetical protein
MVIEGGESFAGAAFATLGNVNAEPSNVLVMSAVKGTRLFESFLNII